MGSTEVATEVAKKCYKNNTAGFLGVVKLNHLGAPEGHSIEPFGTAYLSDDEAKLTARAPKDPANNPFVEQMFRGVDAQGVEHPMPITPLTLISDERFLPGETERFVPGQDIPEHIEAAKRDAQAVLVGESDRDATLPTSPAMTPGAEPTASVAPVPTPGLQTAPSAPLSPPPVPAQAAASTDEPPSWVDNPGRTVEPKRGNLGGGVAVTKGTADEEAVAGVAPPQAPINVGVGGEEHAAQTESGEETGAAETAKGKAVEGEFAQHEEVGSPDAPNAKAEAE